MENFVWDIPTKMFFGKDVYKKISKILPTFGKKVFLIRGGSSLEKNGVLAKIIEEIKLSGMEWVEFSGIKSNPEIEEAREAVKIGVDFCPD